MTDLIRNNRPSLVTFSSQASASGLGGRDSVSRGSVSAAKQTIANNAKAAAVVDSVGLLLKKLLPFFRKIAASKTAQDSVEDGKTLVGSVHRDSTITQFKSTPSIVTFKSLSDAGGAGGLNVDDVKRRYFNEFLSKEAAYNAEIEPQFAKLSSHLSILNHLAGGSQINIQDESIVKSLIAMSEYFIQHVQNETRLEWKKEFDLVVKNFEIFAKEIQSHISKFEKLFPGSEMSLERTESVLQTVKQHFEVYQRLCTIPTHSVYWDLTKDVRDVIDIFYKQEQSYGDFLARQPDTLKKFQTLGILDSAAVKRALKSNTSFVIASDELRTKMIHFPCTYGLNHRLLELSQVYELYSVYVDHVLERLYHYKDATSNTWHMVKEEYTIGQVESLIEAFKKDLAKPLDRLIHFQHLLEYFSHVPEIDQSQVGLARYEVNGIINELFRNHSYQLNSTLKPLLKK